MTKHELDSLDVRTLRILLMLLTERSVSRAAQKLDMSQPAMSHILNRLRRTLDDPLLLRSNNGMVCTERAVEIAAKTQELLKGFDDLVAQRAPFDPRTSKRRFVIAAATYTEHVLLPILIRRIHEQAPHITVEVRPPRYGHAHEQLENGEVDLRVAWGQGPPPLSLRSISLFHDRIVCLTDPVFRKTRGPLSIAAYLAAPHVRAQGTERTTTGKVVDSAVAQFGTSLCIALLVQNYLSIPKMIAHTDFVATLPERFAIELAAHTPLEISDPPLKLPKVRVMAFWHERSQSDPAHKWLRRLAVEASRDLDSARDILPE